MNPQVTAFAALALSAACATPNPPSISAQDVDRAYAEALRISALPATAPADIPTGTVTYDGQIGADVRGDAQGSILADMTMIVGFDTNAIRGSVTNINLVDPDGIPNQRFDGSLAITGIETNGDLDAVAVGQITGVDVDGHTVDADMDLDLVGTVVDDTGQGDAIFGSVTGSAAGDFYLTVDGVFFATER